MCSPLGGQERAKAPNTLAALSPSLLLLWKCSILPFLPRCPPQEA